MITEQQVEWMLKNYRQLKAEVAFCTAEEQRAFMKLGAAIEALPEREKDIIQSIFYSNMSWAQIEDEKYISGNTIARYKRQGIKHITESMNGTTVRRMMEIMDGSGT